MSTSKKRGTPENKVKEDIVKPTPEGETTQVKEKESKPARRENKDSKGGNKERPNRDGKNNKKPRENKNFVYPENWKDAARQEVTLESKLDAIPRDEDKFNPPDFTILKNQQTDLSKKIEKLYNQVDTVINKLKTISKEASEKNSSIFAKLNVEKSKRKELSDKARKNKEEKETIKLAILDVEDRISKLLKKAYNGKIQPKAKIDEIIKKKEDELRNNKYTANEEKKYIEELSELKKNYSLVGEHDSLVKEKKELEKSLYKLKDEGKVLFDQIQVVSGVINEIAAELDLKNNEKPKEGENKDEKKEKPKRELTSEEIKLKEQKDQIYQEIDKLKNKKKELSVKFDEDNYAYQKQKFEILRIEFMSKIQRSLKYEERKKKEIEEEQKLKALEEEKAKELIKFKYREEIESCEDLIRVLNLQKPNANQDIAGNQETAAVTQYDEKQLKAEGLVIMKPKKNLKEEGVQPGQGKKSKKNKSKAVEDNKDGKDSGKLSLDIETLQNLMKLKIMPPTQVVQIDGVITQLEEKKQYFLKLREQEISKDADQTENQNNNIQKDSQVAQPQKEEKVSKRARAELKDEDFPSLA